MSAARTPLIVGNWKMHKTIAQTLAFIDDVRNRDVPFDGVEAVICPPFTALAAAGRALEGSRLGLGAQTMHWADQGAYTGEIAPSMLVECGARWVVLGHSERRALCGETDTTVNQKIRAALAHGLTPIVAVGESADDHAAGRAMEHVRAQVRAAFARIEPAEIARCVVAYEPIWAIGTGNADTPEGADAIMGAIRHDVSALRDARILYGGSMKPDNVAAFLVKPNIDGGLVGGASLDPASFAALLHGARAGATA